ncbi:helix-turn-helix transcriptional regulator [Streptomyces erythrochromogenes]|uniref:helix-turn-helix transcriptional regulator n=1 Tax=Streptomyces erythrochromogenes TaxID=285574 RepID=UPI0038692761
MGDKETGGKRTSARRGTSAAEPETGAVAPRSGSATDTPAAGWRSTGEQGRPRGGAANETVHNRIAVLRVERAITRRQLADALGVHYQTVGYLERGEYSPSLHLALRIAEYFEVPVEVIFSTTPFPRIGSTPPA